MTREEYRKMLDHRREVAGSVIRNAGELTQNHILTALGCRSICDDLIRYMDTGKRPWDDN